MIILPAIPVIVAALTPVVKAAIVSAGIGAAVGGAACGIGGAVSGYQDQDALNREVAAHSLQRAGECAAEGAIVGAVIAPVGVLVAPVVAPALHVVDDVAVHGLNVLDDVAKSAAGNIDDVAALAGSAAIVDDVASPVLSRVKYGAKSTAQNVRRVITAPWRAWRKRQSLKNALKFRELPKTPGNGNEGYVYVMKDFSKAGRYKMGKTTQPVERLSNVKSKTGLKQLDYTCIMKTDDMKTLEKSLFKEFERQRRPHLVNGTTEIFLLNATQVAAACSF